MTSEEQIRLHKFDGSDKMDFERFATKMLAIGGLKDGFDEALENNLPIVDANGKDIPDNIEKRKLAWNHLLLALEGPPLMIIKRISSKDPHAAWTQLIQCLSGHTY
jgi:hypothetical protein